MRKHSLRFAKFLAFCEENSEAGEEAGTVAHSLARALTRVPSQSREAAGAMNRACEFVDLEFSCLTEAMRPGVKMVNNQPLS
jgi:hypothetical protein